MPWSKVLNFTDPFPYQLAIRAADLELLPTARGEFRANLTQVCMNQLWMQRFHQNLPLVCVGSMKPGRKVISFLTATNQPALHHCGIDVSPSEIIVNNVDMLHQQAGADFSLGGMSLQNDAFDVACRAISGRACSETTKTHVVRSRPALMSRLVKLHEMVGQLAKATPDILALPEVARALDQVPDRGCVVGNDHRRSPPRCDRRAARRIPGSAPQHAAVPYGNLRGHRRSGANAPRRL
jgi:hypothetical protein